MNRLRLLALLLVIALLPACRPFDTVATPATPTPAPVPAKTATAEPPTAPPAAEPSPTPPAADAIGDTTGRSPLFDVDPADRTPFLAGLTAAEAADLDALAGAPVYHMDFTIGDDMSTITGRQSVTVTNQEDTALEDLYFHLHAQTLEGAIDVSEVTVDGEPVAADAGDGLLRVPLPSPLAPGDTVTVDMAFTTRVPTDIGRNYGVLAYTDDILALAHFYPMLAVYDDEGWNIDPPDVQGDITYSDAAFYLVRVTAPDSVVLVGSGAAIEETAANGTQTVTFAVGPARDFYLAAGDFVAVSGTAGETTVRSYAPPALAEGAALALDVALAALDDYGARLGAYPYTELEIVTTPTSALGIEYPGVIVGTLRMYDPDAETDGGVPYTAILESTTAHEVAHQWFYNLVGNDQLDEPWLDEAVGSYTTYRYYADRYGQAVAEAFYQTFEGRWARVDDKPIPIGRPVAAYDEDEYGAIVYGRGPIFVRTLEEEMGRDVFDAFLRDYVGRFRWEEGTTEQFRALAEAHCQCDLGPLFAEWVYAGQEEKN